MWTPGGIVVTAAVTNGGSVINKTNKQICGKCSHRLSSLKRNIKCDKKLVEAYIASIYIQQNQHFDFRNMFQVLRAMGSNQGQQYCPILSVCFSRTLEISDLNKGTNMNMNFWVASRRHWIGSLSSVQWYFTTTTHSGDGIFTQELVPLVVKRQITKIWPQ